jgi:retron-type reverse transcriptase
MDRCHQARVRNALEPEWEARFEPRSYGFRPGRGCHDAIASTFQTLCRKNATRVRILDSDLASAFDRIDHDHLLAMIGGFPAKGMIADWLKAGVFEPGKGFAPTEEGTPQGGVMTPPTQWRTWGRLLVGVTVCDLLGGGCGAAGGDAVADEDAFGSDEDVLDEQPQDALLLGDGGHGGVFAELGEEVLQAGSELRSREEIV